MFEQIIFYSFAGLLVLSALMVITVRNPVYAVLFLVLVFFSSAALWLLLRAEFLAIILVLVYVGAVMVLFLFVVMMLDINIARIRAGFVRYFPVGALIVLALVGTMTYIISTAEFELARDSGLVDPGPGYSNTRELGEALFTTYLYPFEIAGVILLVAIIAAITLALRPSRSPKAQDPAKQAAVRRQDRVKLIKMPAEKVDQG